MTDDEAMIAHHEHEAQRYERQAAYGFTTARSYAVFHRGEARRLRALVPGGLSETPPVPNFSEPAP